MRMSSFRNSTLSVLSGIAFTLVAATVGPLANAKTSVTVAVAHDIASWNPYADSTAGMYAIWCQVYGCLGSGNFEKAADVGMLAESWTIPDPNTWIFKLKKGLIRHDGKAELTAADVVHSINRIGTDKRSSQRQNVKKIKTAVAVDKYTVKLTTHKPTAPLLGYVFDRVMITSKELFDKHGSRDADRKHHFGYGPYMLKKLRTGESVVIEKNKRWPGVKKEWPDEVIFRIMREPEQRVTALLNGEIQIAQFIPPHLLPKVRASKTARVEEMGSVELMMLLMNPAFKPWDNVLMRKAVAHAIDRDAIIKHVLKGEAIKLTGPIGPLQFGYNKNVKPTYEYDPEKAKALVKQAGYPNGIDVEFSTPVGRYVNDKQVAQAMIPMLRAVGIRAKLKTPEWSTLWSNVRKGKVAFYYMGRGGMVDPSAALSQYFETGIAPRVKFSSKKVDTLLQKERQTFDLTKRKKYMNDAINALMEEVPAHFLWHQKIHYGVANGVDISIRPDKRIHGYEISVK